MLIKEVPVTTPQVEAVDNMEVVMLTKNEVRGLIKSVMDLSYNKGTDTFECDQTLIEMAEELDVN